MKNCKLIIVALFCAVALLAGAAPSARAQVVTEPERTPISTDTNTPVVVKQKPAKAVWLKAEVIHADRNILIVREVGNEMAIHTFTFSDSAKGQNGGSAGCGRISERRSREGFVDSGQR